MSISRTGRPLEWERQMLLAACAFACASGSAPLRLMAVCPLILPLCITSLNCCSGLRSATGSPRRRTPSRAGCTFSQRLTGQTDSSQPGHVDEGDPLLGPRPLLDRQCNAPELSLFLIVLTIPFCTAVSQLPQVEGLSVRDVRPSLGDRPLVHDSPLAWSRRSG